MSKYIFLIILTILALSLSACTTTVVREPSTIQQPQEQPTQQQPTTTQTTTQTTQQKTTTTTPPTTSTSFAVEADDSGFYMNGGEISSLQVPKDKKITLTFKVRSTNVYFRGLDFRSSKFSTQKAKPGESATISFTEDSDFTITSYWPASSRKKADLDIIAK